MPILDSNNKMTVGTGPHNQHQLVLGGSGPLQCCAFCIHNSTISFQETLPTVKAALNKLPKKLMKSSTAAILEKLKVFYEIINCQTNTCIVCY